jgi:uncharacterized protein (UPF0335 family)
MAKPAMQVIENPMTNTGIAGKDLLAYIERVERLTEERQVFSDDIKEVYAEIKGKGYDTKMVRRLVRERKKTEEERSAEAELYEMYSSAIGMFT